MVWVHCKLPSTGIKQRAHILLAAMATRGFLGICSS